MVTRVGGPPPGGPINSLVEEGGACSGKPGHDLGASQRSAALVSAEGLALKWGQGSANPLMNKYRCSMCSRTVGSHVVRGLQRWNTKNEQPEHQLRGTRSVFRECCSGWMWITAYGDDMGMA